MKLRMRGDSIRLRLTQGEVTALVEKGLVEEHVTFGPGVSLTYAIATDSKTGSKVEAILEKGTPTRVVIRAPEPLVHAWAKDPKEVGFEAAQDVGAAEGKTLRILVEKDFACLVERPHEDNADAFPNPNTTC
jgi:hypothetical protein